MRKSCHLHVSNVDRNFIVIVIFVILHVNEYVLCDSLTPAVIAARVKALKNCIHKALLVIHLTSR
jgi:hypothetical protein